ncbi:MAG: histidine kinase [Alphaproteobacteria bacterium]|jgi:hypothetical protein
MTHFLVSDDKPDGHKIEDILDLVRQDIVKRTQKIVSDNRREARHVLKNNIRILDLLTEAMELAQDSTTVLDKSFGPSEPGSPRIGVV